MKNWNTPHYLLRFSQSLLIGFLLTTFMINLPNRVQACEIYEVVIEKGDCTSDSTYSLWLNFEYVDVQGDYFDLWANGVFFGYYAYADLPITIPNFSKSGNNNDWLKVCDNDNPGCCRIKEFPTKDCANFNDCSITEVSVVKGDCTSEDSYTITIDFDYQNVGGDYFDLWFNGVYNDQYLYSDLPLTIVDFPKSGNNNDWIKICDHEIENCCKVKEFDSKNCSNFNGCEIWDLIVEAHECDGNMFLVDLDFNYENVGSNGFTVQGNGNQYGTFNYNDLYITLGPLEGNCQTNYEFVVKDVDNPDCQAVFILGEVCCGEDCNIYDLEVEKGDCTSDSTYSLTINFQYQNVNGASFDLYANGTFFGYYQYAQLPLTIPNFPKSGGNNDWIKVCDNDNENCCKVLEFDTKECGNNGDCEIYDLSVDKGECTSDSTYTLTINFQYQNVNGASFDLYANGTFFGYYQYAQLPLTIPNFPKSGGNNDWIKVCDNDNENCCKVLEFDTKECGNNGDCEIYDLSVDKGECTSDSTYTLTINFQYQNVNGASFDLYANGTFFGYYQYAQLPLTISNFPKSGGNNDWIKVCDNDNENCCKVLEFDTKECGNNGDCSIKELEAIVGDCNEDDLFYVTINFVAMNPGSQGFSILGNGMNYGSFSYDSIPIILGPFEGNCDKEWEFVVKDNEFEFCSKGIDVGKVCCNVEPCEIYDLEVVVGECTGDSTYALTFNFQVQNPGNNYFEVWTNGDYFGNFPLADLPMTIDFPAGGFNIDELKVCINDQPNCCKTIEFEPPSCLQMPVYTINASNAKKSSQTSTGNNNTFKEQNLNQVNGLKSSFTARTFPGEQRLLILTTPGSIVQHIRIMDAVGRLVGEESPGSGGSSNQFDVPVLALNGIVFVQVTFADGRMVRKIFIP